VDPDATFEDVAVFEVAVFGVTVTGVIAIGHILDIESRRVPGGVRNERCGDRR
jgi:hypothetical protein